jgi:hypothetical protein
MIFKFYFDPYIAVIGDIIKSKKIIDRNEVQSKLRTVLDKINKKYAGEIASNFMITLGDEFQGLLKCGKNAVRMISEIEIAMLPVQLRFGIGIGKIDTEINSNIPFGADGPAYHNARKMIDELKIKEKKYATNYSNIMICSQGDNEQIDMLLNTILSLCSTLKARWTPRQTEIIGCFIASDKNQYKAAGKLGITQSSVNKALNNSNYYTYQKAIDTVCSILSEIKEKNNV